MNPNHVTFSALTPRIMGKFALLLAVTLATSSLLAQKSNPSTNPAATQDYSFKIPANHLWTDTGLDLHPGDRLHVSGAVTDCGTSMPPDKGHLLLPSAPAGALLAKVELAGPAMAASTDIDVPIINPSHLYLGVNGYQCSGAIPVKVRVERKK